VAHDEPADIFEPLQAGVISWDKLIPMAEFFGGHPGRASDQQITMHKNNGLSIQFVAAAAVALQGAGELGLGEKLPDMLLSGGRESPMP